MVGESLVCLGGLSDEVSDGLVGWLVGCLSGCLVELS